MEQNNSRTVINAAQKNADEQKNMILAATELKIKAEHAQTKLTSDLKNTATQLEQLTNDMAKAELDFQLKAENHAAELQVTKVEIAEILSRLAEAESQAQKAATLTKENAIVRALTEAQGEALDRRGKELDAAVKQLKLFSATGLNPDEINALKKKRPIEPVTSRLARVKPIRPGKIITPLQK